MSRWWRAYDEAVDDPKLQQLRPELFKAWFNVCCITSQNGGRLPAVGAIAFKLRLSEPKTQKLLEELRAAGLIDADSNGALVPHNWSGRQFQSDDSKERVKRYRQRQRNVTDTVTVTPPDTEADTEQKIKRADARGVYEFEGGIIRLSKKHFSEWTKAYPSIDLLAELTARDVWLGSERATDSDRKNWFISTSKYLANRNLEAKSRVVALKPEQRPGIPGIL